MTSVWQRHGEFEVSLRDFSTDFRVLVQDVASAYKVPYHERVFVEVRPYGDFVDWARAQEPDWDRYAWDGTKVLVEQGRLPKSAMNDYDRPDLERAGVTIEEWTQLGFEHYINAIAQSIAAGKNVPPLVAVEGDPIDGRHRTLAALKLGLAVAPVINLGDADGFSVGLGAPSGQCFPWAYKHLPDARNARLVHAIVHPHGGKYGDRPYAHAWIERAGRVYDWQSVEQGLGPGRRGWPKKFFYEVYQPTEIRIYDYDDAQLRPWLSHGPAKLVDR